MSARFATGGALRAAASISVTATVLLLTPARVALAGDLDPSRLTWSALSYRAKKLTVSVNTTLTVEAVPASRAAGDLIVPSEGEGVDPDADEVFYLTLGSRGLGKESDTRLWLNPGGGLVLQRTQVDRSKKRNRFRTYRYADRGVHIVSRRPAPGEETSEPDGWSEASESFEAYPPWLGDGADVSDPSALLYLLGAAKLEAPGDVLQLPVFSRGNLLLLELKVTGTERLKVDYTETSPAGERTVKGSVEVIRVLVDASHLDPDSEENDLAFMGLRGDVEVFLERSRRVPVEISGRIPVAGKARVRLQSVALW